MEKKDQYVQKLHATIDDLSGRLDRAEAKARAAALDVKTRYQESVSALRARLDDVRGRLRELDRTSRDTWDAVRKSVDVGIAEFRTEYRRAREERKIEALEALPPAEAPEGETAEQSS